MPGKADAYLDTVKRLEPDIAPIDHAAGIASIAISLVRIADALERLAPPVGPPINLNDIRTQR